MLFHLCVHFIKKFLPKIVFSSYYLKLTLCFLIVSYDLPNFSLIFLIEMILIRKNGYFVILMTEA